MQVIRTKLFLDDLSRVADYIINQYGDTSAADRLVKRVYAEVDSRADSLSLIQYRAFRRVDELANQCSKY